MNNKILIAILVFAAVLVEGWIEQDPERNDVKERLDEDLEERLDEDLEDLSESDIKKLLHYLNKSKSSPYIRKLSGKYLLVWFNEEDRF